MCKRNIDQLPLTCPELGIQPTPRACALTRNCTGDLGLQDDAQPTDSHQSGHSRLLFILESSGIFCVQDYLVLMIYLSFINPSLNFAFMIRKR